jgi:hypothetical protein
MKPIFEDIKQELKKKNINLSHQRLKVLEYLTQNRSHPTVDQIFTDLQKEMPTLSKTTVYNTLRMLEQISGLYGYKSYRSEILWHMKGPEGDYIQSVDYNIVLKRTGSGYKLSELNAINP